MTFEAVSGTGATLTTGDILTGKGDGNTLNILGNGSSAGTLVQTTDVQNVTIRSVAGSTIDQVLMAGVESFSSNNSLAATTVNNAELATVYGLNNTVAGRAAGLTVAYESTTGKADTAQVSLNNAGDKTGSTTTTQAIVLNGSTANSIEGVSISTAGTNYVSLNAGTGAATFTLTGSGNNTVEILAAASSVKVDASATSGKNSINVGGLIGGSAHTVLGGTGEDTLVAAMGTSFAGTVTDVEILDLAFAANQSFNATKVTGATTLDLSGAGVGSFTNLASSVNTVKFDTSATSGGASLSYATGTTADVGVTIGKTTTAGTDTTAITVGSLTFVNNKGTVEVTSTADKTTTTNAVTTLALGTATGLTFNANKAALTNTTTTGSSVTSLEVVATGAAATLGSFAKADALATIALTATGGNVSTGQISADDSLTTITLDAGLTSAGASRTISTSIGKSDTASSKAVSASLSITGAGDSSLSTVGSDTYISSVSSDATGAANVNLSAYTGTSATTVNLGDARTGKTNVVWTGSGNDVITGGTGVDQIRGGKGADIIDGDTGADVIQVALGSTTSAVAQVTVLTPTGLGTGESLLVTIGGTTYTQAWDTDLGTTLDAFETANAAAILAATGVAVTATPVTATALTFTGAATGAAFTEPTGVIVGGAGSVAVVTTIPGSAASTIASDSNLTTLDLVTFVNDSDTITLFNASNTAVNIAKANDVNASAGNYGEISTAGLYTALSTETTLSSVVAGVGKAITAGTTVAGEAVSFIFGGQVYAYISDAVKDYSANGDVVVLVDNQTTTTGLVITSNAISSFVV